MLTLGSLDLTTAWSETGAQIGSDPLRLVSPSQVKDIMSSPDYIAFESEPNNYIPQENKLNK